MGTTLGVGSIWEISLNNEYQSGHFLGTDGPTMATDKWPVHVRQEVKLLGPFFIRRDVGPIQLKITGVKDSDLASSTFTVILFRGRATSCEPWNDNIWASETNHRYSTLCNGCRVW